MNLLTKLWMNFRKYNYQLIYQ